MSFFHGTFPIFSILHALDLRSVRWDVLHLVHLAFNRSNYGEENDTGTLRTRIFVLNESLT